MTVALADDRGPLIARLCAALVQAKRRQRKLLRARVRFERACLEATERFNRDVASAAARYIVDQAMTYGAKPKSKSDE